MADATGPPPSLTPGDAAPDAALVDDQGRSVRLSELWHKQPLVLFVRHLG